MKTISLLSYLGGEPILRNFINQNPVIELLGLDGENRGYLELLQDELIVIHAVSDPWILEKFQEYGRTLMLSNVNIFFVLPIFDGSQEKWAFYKDIRNRIKADKLWTSTFSDIHLLRIIERATQ